MGRRKVSYQPVQPAGNVKAGEKPEEGEVDPRAGFYDRQFKAGEVADLVKVSSNLADEIAMLRVVIRRCFERVTEEDVSDIKDWVKVLSAMGNASFRLSRLVQTQQELLKAGGDDFMADFSAALADAQKDLGIQ